MCNNFFQNMHRILVYVRSNICNSVNTELIRILILCINNNMSNDEMVKEIVDICSVFKQQLVWKNDETYRLSAEAKDFVLGALQILSDALEEKDYNWAYDVVDALHVISHVIIDNNRRQIKSYWKIYIKPILKRTKIKGYDLKSFKSCKV